MSYTEGELHSKQIRDSINSLLETAGSDEIGELIESLENKVATQAELEDVKSELETIKANQTNGEQKVQQIGSNDALLEPETITWNGASTEENTADIDVPEGKEILVRVNNQADQDVDIQLQHKVGTDYVDYFGADGELLTFTVKANEAGVYGVINGFPRFDGGRVLLTADTAPSDTNETIVEVREV